MNLAPKKAGPRTKYEVPDYLPVDVDDDLITWIIMAIKESISYENQDRVDLSQVANYTVEFATMQEVRQAVHVDYDYDVCITITPISFYTLSVDLFKLTEGLNLSWADIIHLDVVGAETNDFLDVITPSYVSLTYQTDDKNNPARVRCIIVLSEPVDYSSTDPVAEDAQPGADDDNPGSPDADDISPPLAEESVGISYEDDLPSLYDSFMLK